MLHVHADMNRTIDFFLHIEMRSINEGPGDDAYTKTGNGWDVPFGNAISAQKMAIALRAAGSMIEPCLRDQGFAVFQGDSNYDKQNILFFKSYSGVAPSPQLFQALKKAAAIWLNNLSSPSWKEVSPQERKELFEKETLVCKDPKNIMLRRTTKGMGEINIFLRCVVKNLGYDAQIEISDAQGTPGQCYITGPKHYVEGLFKALLPLKLENDDEKEEPEMASISVPPKPTTKL